ncbi:MAG: lysoplasmalogenase family protein [Candidatus Binatia bacterium]
MLPANFFAAGLGAFLVGHLFYIGAFSAPCHGASSGALVVLGASAPVACASSAPCRACRCAPR